MGGRGNKIDLMVAQCLVGHVVREDQLLRDVEAFALEEIERDCGDGRKVRIGDEVGDGDAGGAQAASPCWVRYFAVKPGA
jgi:hypothetical protein